METINKEKLHFIGLFRGIEQYEILGDATALLLKCGDKYYFSRSNNIWDYNKNIVDRIYNFYGEQGIKALGELVEVI